MQFAGPPPSLSAQTGAPPGFAAGKAAQWHAWYATAGAPTGNSLCFASGMASTGRYRSKNEPGTPHGRWGLWIPKPTKKGFTLSAGVRSHRRRYSTTVYSTTVSVMVTSGQLVFSGSAQNIGACL